MIDIEVLQLALSKEETSIKVYERIIADHPGLKDLAYELLNEEQRHKAKIEKKIFDLTRY